MGAWPMLLLELLRVVTNRIPQAQPYATSEMRPPQPVAIPLERSAFLQMDVAHLIRGHISAKLASHPHEHKEGNR